MFFLRSGFVMKNDHRQEQKSFYICSPPPKFQCWAWMGPKSGGNEKRPFMLDAISIQAQHWNWVSGGSDFFTCFHSKMVVFHDEPGERKLPSQQNPGLKPLIILQHALRIPLQLGSLSSSFFKPLINACCRNELVHNQRPLQLVIPWVTLQERRYNTY